MGIVFYTGSNLSRHLTPLRGAPRSLDAFLDGLRVTLQRLRFASDGPQPFLAGAQPEPRLRLFLTRLSCGLVRRAISLLERRQFLRQLVRIIGMSPLFCFEFRKLLPTLLQLAREASKTLLRTRPFLGERLLRASHHL